MCEAAERNASNYKAIFVNHNASHDERLRSVLAKQNRLKKAIPILGDSTALLAQLAVLLKDQTVFVYLDPYGLRGCAFATIEPFLQREERFSTELVINMSMPITHRLAARAAVQAGRANERLIVSYHQRLTNILGGDYWKGIYFSDLSADEKQEALMREYRALISRWLPFTGSCPVRETSSSRVKYYITFASRHEDAMLLMNDAMCNAYFGETHKADYAGTLFADIDWRTLRNTQHLDCIVLQLITDQPGSTRIDLWKTIVKRYFMQFSSSEYKTSIARLEQNGLIHSPTERATKRLNDNCRLYRVQS